MRLPATKVRIGGLPACDYSVITMATRSNCTPNLLVALDSTKGSEIRRTRPCVIVSPDELNPHLRTVVVAPMTIGGQVYPWRIACRF